MLAAEIIAFSHDHGNLRAEHSGWHYTADCALLEDNHADALGLYRTSLMLARQTGDRLQIGFEVQGLGDVARWPRAAGPGAVAGRRS